MKGFLSFISVVFILSTAFADRATDDVRSSLKDLGLSEGYDRTKGLFISIAEEQVELPKLQLNKKLLHIQDELFKRAFLYAKAELMRTMSSILSSKDQTVLSSDADISTMATMSKYEILTKVRLKGCIALAAEENYDAEMGVYSLSVAVGWCPKFAHEAEQAQTLQTFPESSLKGINDLSISPKTMSYFGNRRVTGPDGRAYYVGIGCYDAEGAKGAKLNEIRRRAKSIAERNLLFALYCNEASVNKTETIVQEGVRDDSDMTKRMSRFISSISNSCNLRRLYSVPLRTGTIVNPLTGRQMCVCFVGLGPFSPSGNP